MNTTLHSLPQSRYLDCIPCGDGLRALVDPAQGRVIELQTLAGRRVDALTFDPFLLARARAQAQLAWAATCDE